MFVKGPTLVGAAGAGPTRATNDVLPSLTPWLTLGTRRLRTPAPGRRSFVLGGQGVWGPMVFGGANSVPTKTAGACMPGLPL